MKIKQAPDDFLVDEVTDVVPTDGPYALYRLDKVDWTTPDAVNVIRRRWHIRIHRLSYGGLKDRHARTSQHLTIEHGPTQNLDHAGFTLTYLGQVADAFASAAIRANRFRLSVRDLANWEAGAAADALGAVAHDGFANYFDDQRFGSVSSGDFVARRLVQGDWEGALKLALTAPYDFDRGATKQQKSILLSHWGDWAICCRKLARGDARPVVEYLAIHPADFRGAVARLPAELASLYLAAYQSHLWNNALSEWLTRTLPPENLTFIRLKLGDVATPRQLSNERRAELAKLSLPLPSARLRYDVAVPGAPPDWPAAFRQVLTAAGIELEQMKLQGLRRPFFSRGERSVLCVPKDLAGSSAPDERHPGRAKLVLSFELPRGSYATLLVKRLFAQPAP